MRVALYIRVSSEEQALHGLSIEAQNTALEEWAKNHNATIVGKYIDAGISARKKAASRPELQRLLRDVQLRKIDLIVFTKLDRWFRNISEYYKVQEVLEARHVNWKTIHEDYDTSTASGRLKINIMLSVAQDEADRTSERIKTIFESKVQRGEPISGKVPLGYCIENKKIVIDNKTAPIAKDIFNQYLVLRSIAALRRYIIETYGITYCHSGLRALLKNERYIGHSHEQDDFCPALIDLQTFQRVQEVLEVS
jgi:site-specific DNA recombinase